MTYDTENRHYSNNLDCVSRPYELNEGFQAFQNSLKSPLSFKLLRNRLGKIHDFDVGFLEMSGLSEVFAT